MPEEKRRTFRADEYRKGEVPMRIIDDRLVRQTLELRAEEFEMATKEAQEKYDRDVKKYIRNVCGDDKIKYLMFWAYYCRRKR